MKTLASNRLVMALLMSLALKITAAALAFSSGVGVRAEEGSTISGSVYMANPYHDGRFRLPVPAARENEMQERGFAVRTSEHTQIDAADLYQNVCVLAASALQSAENGFAGIYGVTPDEFRQMARQILQGGAA